MRCERPAQRVAAQGSDSWQNPNQTYEIERIVGAERFPNGWRIQVKWVGYSEPTGEPLSRVLKDCKSHPDILQQVEQCQAEWLAAHPAAAAQARREATERPRGNRRGSLPRGRQVPGAHNL